MPEESKKFGLKKKPWTISSLLGFVNVNAQKEGFEVLATISRSRLWSLVYETAKTEPARKAKTEPAREAKAEAITEAVSIFWMPVYLPLLMRADGTVTFHKIEFPTPIRLNHVSSKREGLELICHVGVDSASGRFYASVSRSTDEDSISKFLQHLSQSVTARTRISLYRCSSVDFPSQATTYLKNTKLRIKPFESSAKDQVPGLCAALIIQTCRRRLSGLIDEGIRSLADRSQRCLDGYSPFDPAE